MKRAYLIVITALILGLGLAVLSIPSVLANDSDQAGPKMFSRDSVVYGRTYSEWSAAWEQWSYSIPVAHHPLFDNGDCSVGQSGPVWFLGGKFCANGASCSYTGVVRNCNVPSGKALYFPVFNGEDSALEESVAENPGNEAYQQIAAMRSYEDTTLSPSTVSCWVDGAPISHLKERFRVQSTAFGFTLPADNLLKAVYGNPNFVAGTYFPAVDDGWYVMLSPLPAGPHTIHLHGYLPVYDFTLDVTYNLNVTK
jgi:hypothetical protein